MPLVRISSIFLFLIVFWAIFDAGNAWACGTARGGPLPNGTTLGPGWSVVPCPSPGGSSAPDLGAALGAVGGIIDGLGALNHGTSNRAAPKSNGDRVDCGNGWSCPRGNICADKGTVCLTAANPRVCADLRSTCPSGFTCNVNNRCVSDRFVEAELSFSSGTKNFDEGKAALNEGNFILASVDFSAAADDFRKAMSGYQAIGDSRNAAIAKKNAESASDWINIIERKQKEQDAAGQSPRNDGGLADRAFGRCRDRSAQLYDPFDGQNQAFMFAACLNLCFGEEVRGRGDAVALREKMGLERNADIDQKRANALCSADVDANCNDIDRHFCKTGVR